MKFTLTQMLFCFFLFSIIGWCCETVWCSISNRQFVKRGFFYGPYCPIYGFGGLFILTVALPYRTSVWQVFFIAMVAATLLEYATGWLLFNLFNRRWWDYSTKKVQIGGYVCLSNSILFGLMGVVMVYGLEPVLYDWMAAVNPRALRIGVALLSAVFLIDAVLSFASVLWRKNVENRLRKHQVLLSQYNETYGWYDEDNLKDSLRNLRVICYQDRQNTEVAEILLELERIEHRHALAT